MPAFELTLHLAQRVTRWADLILSLGSHARLPPKAVVCPGAGREAGDDAPAVEPDARKTADEHLAQLASAGRLPANHPLLVLSVRNVLSNLRCLAYVAGEGAGAPVTVEGERLGGRPYHVLGLTRAGTLTVEEGDPGDPAWRARFRWFFSGVPVTWDGEGPEGLFHRVVTEAADPSHVWRIPRGNHPGATEETTGLWNRVHQAFVATLGCSRETAFQAVSAAAGAVPREEGYFHNALGVDAEGRLCQCMRGGRLEEVGAEMRRRFGVRRALCVDNGGSSVVRFYPAGLASDGIQLAALPNHRAAGTAYLVAVLPEKGFTWV